MWTAGAGSCQCSDVARGCREASLPGGWPAHVTEGSLTRGRPRGGATGRAEVRVGVWLPFCNVGSDFGHGCIATVVKDVQILFGLGDAKAAERALQFLVVHRGDGDGRVAVSHGTLVVFGCNVFVPQVLRARPVPAAVGGQGALVGGWRWDPDQRAGVSDGWGAVALPLARRGGRARVAWGWWGGEVLLTHGAGGPDDLDDAAVLVNVLPAVFGAVVGRGWVWFFGPKVSLRLRWWDAHPLHVNVHQEVQLLLHWLNLFFNFSKPAHHAGVFRQLPLCWPFGPILVSHGGSSPNDLVNSTGIRKSPHPRKRTWSQLEAAGEEGTACGASMGQSNSLSPN